jgi:hypothetical protein
VADRLPEHAPLSRLPEMPGRTVTVTGVRLPGWTGGEGFYLWDGTAWAIVKRMEKVPPSWEPLLLRGRWAVDEWGMEWLRVEEMQEHRPSGGHIPIVMRSACGTYSACICRVQPLPVTVRQPVKLG